MGSLPVWRLPHAFRSFPRLMIRLTPRHPPRALRGLTTPTRHRNLRCSSGACSAHHRTERCLSGLLPTHKDRSDSVRLVPWAFRNAPFKPAVFDLKLYAMPKSGTVQRFATHQTGGFATPVMCSKMHLPKKTILPTDIVCLGSNGILRSTTLSQSNLRQA